MSDYKIPFYNHVARQIIRPVFKALFNVLSRVERIGFENIPNDPYILIFNHVSLFEAPLIVAYWPTFPEVLGASDVCNRPGQDILAKAYGGIPIDRGEIDRTALHRTVDAVLSGKSLAIAPEGGRSHSPGMRKAKAGITYLFRKQKSTSYLMVAQYTTWTELLHGKRPRASMIVGSSFLSRLPENGKRALSLGRKKWIL